MATQPTNIIDAKTLENLRRDLEGDSSPHIPDVVSNAVDAAVEPIREIFVGVPELKTAAVGYVFGVLTFIAAYLIARLT